MMSQISVDRPGSDSRKQIKVWASRRSGQRDSTVQKIRYITARVKETEKKLGESEQRISELTTISDSLRGTLQVTMDNYRAVVDEQKATIVALTDQVSQLTDTVNLLKEQNNTVYYIIGTKDELLQKGIITQTGGSRFPPLFAKVGDGDPRPRADPSAFRRSTSGR
jgi:HSP90 family molecular chaperone